MSQDDTPLRANRWRRFDDWDERPLRQDNFAQEDPANGFAAFVGAADPVAGAVIEGTRIVEMDGVRAEDFDAVLISTDHDAIDYAALAALGLPVVDTRNAFASRGLPMEHVTKA